MEEKTTISNIRKLKVSDARNNLSNLNLNTNGNRNELIERLITFYFPSKSELNKDKFSYSDISKKRKKDIIEILRLNNLSIEGDKPTLVNRLDNFYHPNKKKKSTETILPKLENDSKDTSDIQSKQYEKYSESPFSKEVDMLLIDENDETLGVYDNCCFKKNFDGIWTNTGLKLE